jgi:hypothetical protein
MIEGSVKCSRLGLLVIELRLDSYTNPRCKPVYVQYIYIYHIGNPIKGIALEILDRIGMLNCDLISTPADTTSKLTLNVGTPFDNPPLYRSLAGYYNISHSPD